MIKYPFTLLKDCIITTKPMYSAEPPVLPHRSCVQKIYENIDQGNLTAPTNGKRTILKAIVTRRQRECCPVKNVRKVMNPVRNCFFFY